MSQDIQPALFIGGPLHCQKRAVPGPTYLYRTQVDPRDKQVRREGERVRQDEEVEVAYDETSFLTPGGPITVFVLRGFSKDESEKLLGRVLAGQSGEHERLYPP